MSTGLAAHNQDLADLITNVDSMASQTNSLVSQDSPQLNSLLQSLHADLTVLGQHQDDLADADYLANGATIVDADLDRCLQDPAVAKEHTHGVAMSVSYHQVGFAIAIHIPNR